MQKHRSRNSEDDVRSQKSHYTNVSKPDSVQSKNFELSLEVELDDEVRNIIKHPEKCPSALLDVTVIKPKGLDQYSTKTQILKSDQVKRLIASMTLDQTDKRKLMEKLFGRSSRCIEINDKSPEHQSVPRKEGKKRKSCLSTKTKHKKPSMEHGDVQCMTDETISAVISMHNQKPERKDPKAPKVQQIYTTPKTYENIRSMFACKNKRNDGNENDKMDQPCLCQNCAIVGILTDSQKKPFATEPIPDPMSLREAKFRRPSRKKSVSFKHLEDLQSATNPSHDQCQAIFKILAARINELEKRVCLQEEKAVPKDYFKKIITKLVTHLSKLTHYTTEERNLSPSPRHHADISSHNRYKTNNRYYVNPVLLDNGYKLPAEKEYDPKPCSSSEVPRGPSESLWKWGGDLLTSSRDLKNKVVVLLEDTLHNLKKGWDKTQNTHKCDNDIQTIVDELSKNLAETVNTKGARVNKLRPGESRKAARDRGDHKTLFEMKSGKPSLIPRPKRNNEPVVNVAYINPQLTRWPEESSVSFKVETSSDYDSHRENMSNAKRREYKREFLRILENTKTTDKFKLWQNIWNQALENRQNKTDTVTIQIPDPKDLLRQKMIHLEYTIGELEVLLIDNHDQLQNSRR